MKILNSDDYLRFRNIWVIAEVDDRYSTSTGSVNPVTHEIAGRGRLLADSAGAELWVIVAGNLGSRKGYDDIK